tara:strand:+ start:2851 stop:3312 length:462 start_codon:yes stop_codon:yes gene_type:complete
MMTLTRDAVLSALLALAKDTKTPAEARVQAWTSLAQLISADERQEVDEAPVVALLTELMRVAFSDPRKLIDANGQLFAFDRVDTDTAAAVQSVEIEERDGHSRVVACGMHEKTEALATLADLLHVDDSEALLRIRAQVQRIIEAETEPAPAVH